jgi:peptidyl-prolyl cis-trans isomerase C
VITPRLSLSGAGLVLALALPVHAQDTNADTVLATVGNVDITLGNVIVATSNLPTQYQQLPDDVLFNGILDQMIQQEALSQALGDDLSRSDRLGIENELRALRAAIVLQGAAEAAVTDEALQEAYDARFADATPATEYNANHILVETEDEAKALIAELEGGADFETLAKEHSTGPSGPNGGALGWFGLGMMVPEFEQAVVALEPGAISGPVQTQFGWHVIKLNETRLAEAPTLDQMREELTNEIQETAVREAIDSLTGAVEVVRNEADIDPALIRQGNLLD